MTIERMLKLCILQLLKREFLEEDTEFTDFLKENYNLDKIDDDYIPLMMEFLTDYALNKTEKSE